MPRALLSVSDKTGIVDARRGARRARLSSWCPPAARRARSPTPACAVTNVSDVTGFPEMMDGRVKTLHPSCTAASSRAAIIPTICAAVARARHRPRSTSSSSTCIRSRETAKKPGVAVRRARSSRSISAGRRWCARPRRIFATCWSSSIRNVRRAGRSARPPGGPALDFRFALAQDAFAHTGQYDIAIASTLYDYAVAAIGLRASSRGVTRREFRPVSAFHLMKLRDLRYGENPHQKAALFEGFFDRFTPWADSAGERAVVYEPARSRRGGAYRAGVRGARGRRRQAHQPVRRGDRRDRRRRLRPRARRGQPRRVRRHRRDEPADRRGAAEAIASTFIEAVIAPGVDDTARADPGEESEHARRRRRFRAARHRSSGPRRRGAALDARRRCSSSSATAWSKRDAPWSARRRCRTDCKS